MDLKKYYDDEFWSKNNLDNSKIQDKKWFRERFDLFDKFVIPQLKPNMKVLEMGCCWGYLTNYLHKKTNLNVEGSDISTSGIREAKRIFNKLTFFKHDIEGGPTKKKYDAIILFGILEHLFDYDCALKNIYQSLNSGGKIFIQIPCITWIRNRINFLFGDIEGELTRKPHIRFYSPKRITKLLEENNFNVQKIIGFGKFNFCPSLCGTLLIIAYKK